REFFFLQGTSCSLLVAAAALEQPVLSYCYTASHALTHLSALGWRSTTFVLPLHRRLSLHIAGKSYRIDAHHTGVRGGRDGCGARTLCLAFELLTKCWCY
ncbi:unnamed protein product, partial [Ectocarpus sp. 13 AM-2016]